MDIEILLWYQNFRNGAGSFLAPYFNWVTEFSVSFWPLAMLCMIYWAFDRKVGKRLFAGFGLGLLMNGLLKLIFCVYRPWIRDARIEPYGNSKVAATGYSFPSGHTTWATSIFGGVGLWFKKQKKKWPCIVLLLLMISVMVSRNYLGVHTPQDVLVGFLATSLMMLCANTLENWSDQDTKRDKIILIGGIILCVCLALFYELKSYPLTYLEDGSLLVDPEKMKADSFQGIGFISAYVICRVFERKSNFDSNVSWKDRFIIGVFCLIPLYYWMVYAFPMLKGIHLSIGTFVAYFVCAIYVFIIVPKILEKKRI